MPICSYLVIPAAGATGSLVERISALPGCEVVPAQNRDLLLLVTETASRDDDEALRAELGSMEGLDALVLTFGEIDSEAAAPGRDSSSERRLPILEREDACSVQGPPTTTVSDA